MSAALPLWCQPCAVKGEHVRAAGEFEDEPCCSFHLAKFRMDSRQPGAEPVAEPELTPAIDFPVTRKPVPAFSIPPRMISRPAKRGPYKSAARTRAIEMLAKGLSENYVSEQTGLSLALVNTLKPSHPVADVLPEAPKETAMPAMPEVDPELKTALGQIAEENRREWARQVIDKSLEPSTVSITIELTEELCTALFNRLTLAQKGAALQSVMATVIL